MNAPEISREIDQAKAWELYCTLGGDVAQVALALGGDVEERDVVAVVQRFGWVERLRRASTGSGALRAVNRGRNLSQALRLQRILDGVLESIEAGGKEARADWTTQIIKGSAVRTGGPLMQLASAVDIAQKLTYRALGDTPEVTKEDVNARGAGSGDLMLEMQRALQNSAKALGRPPGELAAEVVG